MGFGEIQEVRSGDVLALEGGLDVLATYFGQGSSLKKWLQGAQINTDRNLRLQYLAGMGLNADMGNRIMSSLVSYYQSQSSTFVGLPESVVALEQALEQARNNFVR